MGTAIEIEVRLYHALKKYLPHPNEDFLCKITLPAGATVAEAANRLKIPSDHATLAFVNGNRVEPGMVLRDGDRLTLMQPAGGG
ncbi:MoaD/ThiS family protein [Desulfoferula mesophila]|uniref:MoaD/ThiS family protein n=1 Tax=Desulfoferula mesophila TaxID=3058419 RepID=UPI003312FF12